MLRVLVAVALLAGPDAGTDAPLEDPIVVHLENGHYDFNKRAFDLTDEEFRRLQKAEEEAKNAKPMGVVEIVAISGTVGLVLGAIFSAAIVGAIKSKTTTK